MDHFLFAPHLLSCYFGPSKENNIDQNPLDDTLEEEEEEEDEEQKEREEILKEDPVAKWQFAYNENTMYANDMPESTTTNEEKSNDVFVALKNLVATTIL